MECFYLTCHYQARRFFLLIPKIGIIIPNMGIEKSGLSNILFSKARQRVLWLLYGQPDREFHTNEIIRLSRS